MIKVARALNLEEDKNHMIEKITKKLNQIEKERKQFGEKAVKIPEVKWADVGGLASAKEDIL